MVTFAVLITEGKIQNPKFIVINISVTLNLKIKARKLYGNQKLNQTLL